MEKKAWGSAAWKIWSKGIYGAFVLALIFGTLFTAGVRPAQAAAVTVGDWDALSSAFSSSASDTTIRLEDNIAQTNGFLLVPVGRTLTLDLAGFELSIASGDNSAIRVDQGASFIIDDTSEGKSGRLTAVTTASLFAAIGGGHSASAGAITISGGNVEARNSYSGIDGGGAGIGGGSGGSGGTITIEGGTVTASGGVSAAGIGGGSGGSGGTITISGGTVMVSGGDNGAGIGGGDEGPGGNVVIAGGTVTTTGGYGGAGVGGGYNGSGGTVVISNAELSAKGGLTAAGIGGGYNGDGGTITIVSGTVAAVGDVMGAGIGGGYHGSGGTITIENGSVIATGGSLAAGIGGGYQRHGGNVTIAGGTVTATGNGGGAGIGGGYQGNGGNVVIAGGTVMPSSGNTPSVSVIGSGFGAPDPLYSLGNAGAITIPEGYQLIIPGGVTVTNTGSINGQGSISGLGEIDNTGAILVDVSGTTVSGYIFELQFDLNGSSEIIPPMTVYAATLQEADVALPQPTREGYSFEGWYTEADGGVEITATYPLGDGLTLFAHWRESVPPTVTLSTDASDPTNEPFTVEAAFSEEVTGFDADDIEVDNGTVSGFQAEDSATYTFVVTPTADGEVTVQIAAGVAEDAAGNANKEAVPLIVTYDGTAPVISLSSTGQSDPAQHVETTATVTDASELTVLAYVWTQDELPPAIDAPEWQSFASGATLEHVGGDGDWYVHIYAMDEAHNANTVSFGPFVLDNTAPVIVLGGDNPLAVALGSVYTDPGATAEDDQDGDITAGITVTGSVYTDTAGAYELVYRVADSAGNVAPEVTRTVHVIAPPTIALQGLAEITIGQGRAWSDPGATATDAYYGDLSERIAVSGTVDTRTPAVYTLRYTVENPIGQSAEAMRTVTVTRAPADPPVGDDNGNADDPLPEEESEADPSDIVEIVHNGLPVWVDAVTEKTEDGRTLVRLRLTAEQIAEWFAASAEARVEMAELGDVVVLELPAGALQKVRRTQPEARLQVIVDGHGMTLPLGAADRVSATAVVAVTIGRASAADSDAVRSVIEGLGAEALMAQPMVYALDADGRPLEGWSDAYRERTMTLSAAADPHRSTAVRIDERYGLHFVPSVFADDGRTVTIPTRQDGMYTVIRSERTFADVAEHWAKAEIELMANKRIITGRETGEFAPSDPVTRAEFAALLVRGLGLPEREDLRSFTDVTATQWYAGAVVTASEAGLIQGYEDGSFRPQEGITREQMAVMIARALAYAGQAPQAEAADAVAFADEAEMAAWAKEAVAQLAGTGIIQGVTATEFAPQADASRAQSAVILQRLLQYIGFVNP